MTFNVQVHNFKNSGSAARSAALVPTLLAIVGCGTRTLRVEARSDGLEQVSSFGANPGNLTMYRYAPAGVAARAPLVVAMHACNQTAADYVNAGWNQLADRYGFYVLYPEQKTANNSLQCFNWSWDPGSPLGLKRGTGENESIKEMVDRMKSDFSIDSARVFVTGFSAGGAEVLDMLALWPELFAAGASLAGVPFLCAPTLADTSTCFSPGVTKTAAQWGDLVRQANPGFAGPYPRLLIWHGAVDSVVTSTNVGELTKQWTNVVGIDAVADETDTSGILTHQQFQDSSGHALVETFQLANLDHFVPIDPQNECGTNAPYFLDVAVCATSKIASAWGLTVTKPDDGGVVDDLAIASDLSVVPPPKDLATPADLATASAKDLAAPVDLAMVPPPADLATRSDLATAPATADLATPADLAAAPPTVDLAAPADLADLPPTAGGGEKPTSSGCSAAPGGTPRPLSSLAAFAALVLVSVRRVRRRPQVVVA